MPFHALLIERRRGVGTGVIGYSTDAQKGALPELTGHFRPAKLNAFFLRFCKTAKFYLLFVAFSPPLRGGYAYILSIFFYPAALMDKRRIKFVIWPFGWIDNDLI